mgnify:CR=1 FL=1
MVLYYLTSTKPFHELATGKRITNSRITGL